MKTEGRRSEVAWLHLYAQEAWHEPAYIVANRFGLQRLLEALKAALASEGESKTTKETFVSGDGEGYALHIQPVDDPKAWERLALPYVGEEAKERRRDALWPWAIQEAKHESDGLKDKSVSGRGERAGACDHPPYRARLDHLLHRDHGGRGERARR